MKGTGTAAGIGAHAPRPPQTLDDRSGRSTHRATDARQRPPPAGMPPPYSSRSPPAPPPIRSPYPPNAPRPRPAAPDRAAAAPRTGPARARRARPVRCRARRPRGAPAWRRRRTRRAHSPERAHRALAHHHALEFALVHVIGQYVLRFHIGSLPRPGRRDGARCGHWRYDRRVAPARLAYSGHSIPHSCQRRLRPLPCSIPPWRVPRAVRAPSPCDAMMPSCATPPCTATRAASCWARAGA